MANGRNGSAADKEHYEALNHRPVAQQQNGRMDLRSNLHLRRYAEPFVFDWTRFVPYERYLCLPAIAVSLLSGLAAHHPGAGTIAGGGAISVGFGSFQSIRNSRIAPMLLASLGMFAAAFVGTMAGHSVFVLACFSALWGFVYGLLLPHSGPAYRG